MSIMQGISVIKILAKNESLILVGYREPTLKNLLIPNK